MLFGRGSSAEPPACFILCPFHDQKAEIKALVQCSHFLPTYSFLTLPGTTKQSSTTVLFAVSKSPLVLETAGELPGNGFDPEAHQDPSPKSKKHPTPGVHSPQQGFFALDLRNKQGAGRV